MTSGLLSRLVVAGAVVDLIARARACFNDDEDLL